MDKQHRINFNVDINLKNLKDLKDACPLDPSWKDILNAATKDVNAAIQLAVKEVVKQLMDIQAKGGQEGVTYYLDGVDVK